MRPQQHHTAGIWGSDRLDFLMSPDVDDDARVELIPMMEAGERVGYQLLIDGDPVSHYRYPWVMYKRRVYDSATDNTDDEALKIYEEEMVNALVSRWRLANCVKFLVGRVFVW